MAEQFFSVAQGFSSYTINTQNQPLDLNHYPKLPVLTMGLIPFCFSVPGPLKCSPHSLQLSNINPLPSPCHRAQAMSHPLSHIFDAELESHAALLLQYVFTYRHKPPSIPSVHEFKKEEDLGLRSPWREGCIESENHQLFPSLELHKSWIITVVDWFIALIRTCWLSVWLTFQFLHWYLMVLYTSRTKVTWVQAQLWILCND